MKTQGPKKTIPAEALIFPFFEGKQEAFPLKGLKELFEAPLSSEDFTGKKEEVLCHYSAKGKRVILVGLGKESELTLEGLRRGYANAICAIKSKVSSVEVQIPSLAEKDPTYAQAVIEGVLLSNYVFDAYKSQKDKHISQISFLGVEKETLKNAEILCQNVCFARDLVIGNANIVTPLFLAEKAEEIAKQHPKVSATILKGKQIREAKLTLFDAVSQGSSQDPALILLHYQGDPKSKDLTAIIGKGVTFDTGGLNLKPTGFMETMRDDMAGGAAVLGAIRAASMKNLPLNILAAVGATENAIGSRSYKPGDVYTSYSGIQVEVSNTDAEGRLVLADVLGYVQENYSPKYLIDLATLTGGAIVALGEEASALMCEDPILSKLLMESGEECYERLWPLPLYEEYNQLLKSKVADINNSGPRKASAIQGGIFLKKFIKKGIWAHIDIAGTAFPESLKSYQPVQATGVGVRLLTSFFEKLCKKKYSVSK